jgi:REP element-mobilizing transposase RayT
MSHTYSKIWIHTIFSTKDWKPIINGDLEKKLYEHIKNSLNNDFKSNIKAIGGNKEHIHILFLLNPNYSLSEIIKNIKGESSHWVNSNNLTFNKFAWQVGYGAFSVSESSLEKVINYILKQKEHHKKLSFMEEYELFVKKHSLKFSKLTQL